ncbi:STY0301 family protein [Zavarzinia sp.]|uniref:STY0301 family protein n=1 Tax=Zavarzinia sp. TaxID=2027920 RepID=UPI003563905B
MSSNRGILALALLLAPGLAQAAEVACPAAQGGAPLANVTLFDGPPEELASLVPDDSTRDKNGDTRSTWDVSYIPQAGRTLYVQCDYGKATAPVTLKAEGVQSCAFVQHKDKTLSLTCR